MSDLVFLSVGTANDVQKRVVRLKYDVKRLTKCVERLEEAVKEGLRDMVESTDRMRDKFAEALELIRSVEGM
jgi:predicted RNA-binding protein